MPPGALGREASTGFGTTSFDTSPMPIRRPALRRIASTRAKSVAIGIELGRGLLAGLAERFRAP